MLKTTEIKGIEKFFDVHLELMVHIHYSYYMTIEIYLFLT